MAVPVQINFAFHGGSRLAREVKAAIGRREQQQVLALRAAASLLENELKSTVTGLLLQSQLALAEPAVDPETGRQIRAGGRARRQPPPQARARPSLTLNVCPLEKRA